MTQFHEGQEVEVSYLSNGGFGPRKWREAKIISIYHGATFATCVVEFPSGVRVAFGANHIRAAEWWKR